MNARIYRIVVILIGLLAGLGLALPAHAEDGDRIRSFTIDYSIREDGLVDVVETIDYEFAGSDRHGIYRALITRQPDGDTDQDVLYGIDDIAVSSPDASADFTTSTHSKGLRTKWTELKIGDADETIDDGRAGYRISYTVDGALRTINGIPELYWNATGNGWDAAIDDVRITVNAPAGVTSVSCYQGPPGSTQQCSGAVRDGAAVAQAQGLDKEEGVTIAVQVPAGSVRNAVPTLEPAQTFWGAARLGVGSIAATVGTLVLSLLAFLGMRRANRDRRFGGVTPGIVEPSAPTVIDTIDKDTIPVRFNPPDVPPALGGKLLNDTSASKAAAATLVELANAGALTIEATPQDAGKFKKSGGMQRVAVARDLGRAPSPYAAKFARDLFKGAPTIVLDKPEKEEAKRFASAVSALNSGVAKIPKEQGWKAKGGFRGSGVLCALAAFFMIFVIVISFVLLQIGALAYLGPLVLVICILGAAAAVRLRGYRTPTGRALTDQVEGFKRYLSTAEAGTLRFEEGQDIFSAFLPWAITFGVAERWQKVCRELAEAGRIPDSPVWYSGPAFYSSFDSGSSFGDSLSTSVSSSTSSGSSGGGSSGGGGGGGGGGSW